MTMMIRLLLLLIITAFSTGGSRSVVDDDHHDTNNMILTVSQQTEEWLALSQTRRRTSSSSISRIGHDPQSSRERLQRRPPHGHRRLLLKDLLDFIFRLFSLGGWTTCRAVGDGTFETRDGLDILSFLLAITIGGEKSGACDDESSPVGNGGVGQVCNTDDDCTGAFVCKSRVCLATPDCHVLKHKVGDPFTDHRITLVMVGHNFTDHASFTNAVNQNYDTIQTFEFFANDITLLNVLYVLPAEGQTTGYCRQPCGNITRLLCCDINDARALSARCFTAVNNVQTLVLHNSVTYGGAGYPAANVATASLHPLGPKILVHELGHSLFEFGDEYREGTATSFYANCDEAGCRKWNDLVGRNLTGYDPVACLPNVCSQGRFYAGTRSFMDQLDFPIGAVNARFACCAYLSLTKSTPAYCNKFEIPRAGALLSYCRDNDYQHFGAETYERRSDEGGRSAFESTVFGIAIADMDHEDDDKSNIFTTGSTNNPVVIAITREAVERRPIANQGVVFFPSLEEASSLLPGHRRVVVLEYKLASAATSTRLLISATAEVHVPLLSSSTTSTTTPDSVRLDTNFIQVEVEANVDDVEYATAELVVVVD